MNIILLRENVDNLLNKVLNGEKDIPNLSNRRVFLKNGIEVLCYDMLFNERLTIEWRSGFIFAIIDNVEYLLNNYNISLGDDNIEIKRKEWNEYIQNLFIKVREYSKSKYDEKLLNEVFEDLV